MTATQQAPTADSRQPHLPPPGRAQNRGTRRRRSGEQSYGPRAIAAAVAVAIASLAVAPIFQDLGWAPASLIAILAVSWAGGIGRALRAPMPMMPLIEAFALLVVLVHLFTPQNAWGTVLPGPAAINDLRDLFQDAIAQSETLTPPIPSTTALVSVTALGIGFVMLIVDILAVSIRLAPAAAMCCFALYLPPVLVTRGGAPWWSFAAATIGFVVLLVSDERANLRAWGPIVRRKSAGPARVSGLALSGTLLAAIALIIAVGVPAILPQLSEPILGKKVVTGGGGGTVTLAPLASLRQNLRRGENVPVLNYNVSSKNPVYLRQVALTEWTGTEWQQSDSAAEFPIPASGEVPIGDSVTNPADWNRVDFRVNITGLGGSQLPAPFPVVTLSAPGPFQVSDVGTITRLDDSVQNLKANAESLDVNPTTTQLRKDNATDPATALSNVPPAVAQLAREVTRNETNDFDRVMALQDFFTAQGKFVYDTSITSGDEGDYLSDFLLTTRRGYCQQFAASFAVMAGSLGFQTRVAVGFASGTKQSDGSFVVSSHDAHAWPEVLFPGFGWLRFEPTPRAGGSVVAPTYAFGTNQTPSASPSPSTSAANPVEPRPSRPAVPTNPGTTTSSDDSAASSVRSAVTRLAPWLAGLAIAGALLAIPAVIRRRRRITRLSNPDPHEAIEGAWLELRDLMTDSGRPWSTSDTPRQAGVRMTTKHYLTSEAITAVGEIVGLVETSRFAASTPVVPDLTTRVSAVQQGVRAPMTRWERWLMTMLPASVVGRIGRR